MEPAKKRRQSGTVAHSHKKHRTAPRLSTGKPVKKKKKRTRSDATDLPVTGRNRLRAAVSRGKQRLDIRLWTREEWASVGLLMGLAAALLLFFHFFLPHQVDGSSMAPTLRDDHRILVAKTAAPKRYAIVTFHPTDDPEGSYVKRVMGLPGDGLWVVDEHTLFLKDGAGFSEEEKNRGELPEGCTSYRLSQTASAQLAAFETIPEATYFVVGDNRANSTDSRIFGLVKEEQLEGVVIGRYFPFTQWGRIS